METSLNPALRQPEVRAAMKKQQLARLEAKAKVITGELPPATYSAMYEQQPIQKARRLLDEARRVERQNQRAKEIADGIASATGGAEVFRGGAQ